MHIWNGTANGIRSSSSHEFEIGEDININQKLNRPQAMIKVRRTNEAQNAVKLATLRQLSQESGQRDRQSQGSDINNYYGMHSTDMEPVIDTLIEEDEDSIEQQKPVISHPQKSTLKGK